MASLPASVTFEFQHNHYQVDPTKLMLPKTLIHLRNGAYLEGQSVFGAPTEVPPWRAWLRRRFHHDLVAEADRLPQIMYRLQPNDVMRSVHALQAPTLDRCQAGTDAPQQLELIDPYDPIWRSEYTLRDLQPVVVRTEDGLIHYACPLSGGWPGDITLSYRANTGELRAILIVVQGS